MEDLRNAASAYYGNLPDARKQSARECFQRIDTNHDERISFPEYVAFFKNERPEIANPMFFKSLDEDGKGTLNFKEFITAFYICAFHRVIFCKECSEFLKGLYFTCVNCFGQNGETYDLCCDCYRRKNYAGRHHSDAAFLDNFALLRTLRSAGGLSGKGATTTSNQSTVSQGINAPTSQNTATKPVSLDLLCALLGFYFEIKLRTITTSFC